MSELHMKKAYAKTYISTALFDAIKKYQVIEADYDKRYGDEFIKHIHEMFMEVLSSLEELEDRLLEDLERVGESNL